MNSYGYDRKFNRDVETAAFQYVVALVFLWLLTAFWQLQVQNPEEYEQRAARNSVKSLPVMAPRGKILDRDGRILVDNTPSFKVILSRDELNLDHLPIVAEGLGFEYDRLRARLKEIQDGSGPEYQRVILKDKLTPAQVAFLEARRAELGELELILSQQRLYPRGGLAGHILGYVGEISEGELQQDEFVLYEPGAEVGKAGVERQYNDALSGSDGSRLVMVDSRSRRVRDLDVVPANPGESLRLTIDLDLQAVGELAMEGRRGALVALDPRNGEVLALVTSPSYDPNKFVGGIDADEWRAVLDDPDKPMLNRAVQAQLAPGSIFKPIVALAALSEGLVDDDFKVHCSGGASFYGRYFRCHLAGGHGWVDMEKALAQSCDVYFYTLGKELGIDRIAKYAELAGFGGKTGIDMPHEEEGVVPSMSWKARFYRDRWWPGETISVSIGQGALTVTPLQAAHAIGGLAVGGEWHRPHLISYDQLEALDPSFQAPEPQRLEVDQKHIETIRRGMRGVVSGGTGVRAQIPGYDVCGKTGTAQRVSRNFAQDNEDPRYRDDGWFVAFAPCESPEIAVSVLWENGEHGSLAAPIARDVIKSYLDKKVRTEWAQRTREPSDPALSPAPRPELAASRGEEAGR